MAALSDLSDRDLEILSTYARLGSQDEAAKVLGVHKQTVKNYMQSIKKKTGAVSVVQVLWWVLDGDAQLASVEKGEDS